MLHYFKAFTFFLLWAIIALTFHFFISNNYFNNCNLKSSSKNAKQLKSENKLGVHLLFKTDTLTSFDDALLINNSNPQVTFLENFNAFSKFTKNYLTEHYDTQLNIITFFNESNKNSESHKNLMNNRAKKIKNKLVESGISTNRISITNTSLKKENLNNQASLNFKLSLLPKRVIDSINTEISNKRLYINFKDNKLIETPDLINYANLLKNYSYKYPSKKITITGHTDNKGYYQNNLIKGMNRAKLVKQYFVNYGIESEKIITSSKGESEPIADKNTAEGKALNQRIEIKIN